VHQDETQQANPYVDYLRSEWDLFGRDPSRARGTLEAVGTLQLTRILDVGCGAAQELLPFVTDRDVFGVGIDRAPEAGPVARERFSTHRLVGRVAFARGRAEQLPYRSSSFDLVICRLALPYTSNAQTLSEMARVVRPNGLILLQFFHARYYAAELATALRKLRLRSALHNFLVLVAGAVYLATGNQPRARIIGGEVFQTYASLRRELSRCGLEIRDVMRTSNTQTPSLILVKK
jgi:SAM-dependent methyltransferase